MLSNLLRTIKGDVNIWKGIQYSLSKNDKISDIFLKLILNLKYPIELYEIVNIQSFFTHKDCNFIKFPTVTYKFYT